MSLQLSTNAAIFLLAIRSILVAPAFPEPCDRGSGKDNNLAKITKKFCEEEKEHLDFASEHDTGSDLFHSALKKGIKLLSKSAIKISEKA